VIIKVVILSLTSVLVYKIYTDDIKIYQPTKLIEFDSTQINNMKVVLDHVLNLEHVELVGVMVYQPDGVPKEKKILYYAKGDSYTYEDVLELPYVRKEQEIGSSGIYYSLQYKPTLLLDETGNKPINYLIKILPDVKNVLIIGLYKYGTPYGSLIICYNKKFDVNCKHDMEFVYGLMLQGIMFGD
jgi:hypothetical protein